MLFRPTNIGTVILLFLACFSYMLTFGPLCRTCSDTSTGDLPANPNVSIGINLASSYGAIVARYPDGSFVTATANGTAEYREVMARLSRPSSQHLA
jgi:hypothetical protein